jgi:RimJ/RimL family protein N-acetyltransferase
VTQPPSLPRGYPLDFQRLVRLHDGRRVFIRPNLPGDAPELAEAISTADAGTIHRRFLGGRPHVTAELVAHLTKVDYVRRFALVAIDPARRQGVAVARYESAGDGVAEVAVAVAPAWRDAGLATELVQLLAQAAAGRGIHAFTGTYLAENRPVAALIRDAGATADQVTDYGIAEFSVQLCPRDPGAARTSRSLPMATRASPTMADLSQPRRPPRRTPPPSARAGAAPGLPR